MLKIIKDLGYIDIEKKQKVKFCIFECPVCNVYFKARHGNVYSGNTKTCGCVNNQEKVSYRNYHNKSKTRLYSIHNGIKQRCNNHRRKAYVNYGGRGIKICNEWDKIGGYLEFERWALNNGYSDNLTIERINNDGNYEPSNCTWIPKSKQSLNTRKSKKNTSGYRGVYKCKNKWRASVRINGKNKHLICSFDPLECAIARDTYIIENNMEHTLNGVL